MKYYDEATKGFYDSELHHAIPTGAFKISETLYQRLKTGQEELKIIYINNEIPDLKDPDGPSQNEIIKNQIVVLESQQTPRRMREALLGTDNGWLAGIESQIETLRTRLVNL